MFTSHDLKTIFYVFLHFIFQVYELRRGVKDALTYAINFSMDSSLLCSVSSRGTCHVWKLNEEEKPKNKIIEGKRSATQIQIPDFSPKSGMITF